MHPSKIGGACGRDRRARVVGVEVKAKVRSRSLGYPEPLPHLFFSPTPESCTCVIGFSWLNASGMDGSSDGGTGEGVEKSRMLVDTDVASLRETGAALKETYLVWVVAYQMAADRCAVVTWR